MAANLAIVISAKDMASAPMKGIAGSIGGVVSGLGKIGLAGMGLDVVTSSVKGLGEALGFGLNMEMETVRAQFMAFTKDAAVTEDILADLKVEAAKTPFAFKEMATAAAALTPAAKQANVQMMDLMKTAEILAASNPAQGLEGAAFSLREAASGDFTSVIERFNLSRVAINALKAEGVPSLEIVSRAMADMGYDMSLVSNMSLTASGRWSTLMDSFDSLKMKLSEPVFNLVSSGMAQFQTFLDANMGTFMDWADTIGEAMGAVAYSALQGDVGGAFKSLVSFAEDTGNKLGIELRKWGQQLVDWVGPMIPPMLKELGGLWLRFETWMLGDALPNMAIALSRWADEFIDWIEPMIPPMLTNLGNFLSNVLDWLIVNGPILASTFIREWVPAAIGWVSQTAIEIVPKLLEMMGAITTWILTVGLPKLVEAAWKTGQALISGIMEGMGSLAGQLANKLLDLLNFDFGWVKLSARGGVTFDIPTPSVSMPSFGGGDSGSNGSGGKSEQELMDFWEYNRQNPGHNAAGTDFWRGGLSWVGERGPELLNLPRGSQVIPNERIGGSTVVNVNVAGNVITEDDLMRAVMAHLRHERKVSGPLGLD